MTPTDPTPPKAPSDKSHREDAPLYFAYDQVSNLTGTIDGTGRLTIASGASLWLVRGILHLPC